MQPDRGKERVSSAGTDRSNAGCGTPAGKASEDDRKDAAHFKPGTDRAVCRRKLGDREKIYASELPMETMDDFIRLIYVRLYGSRKKMRYRIEKAEGANKISGEFDFPDFAIIKR